MVTFVLKTCFMHWSNLMSSVGTFFQKMKSCMAEAEFLQPVYTKMADSIK